MLVSLADNHLPLRLEVMIKHVGPLPLVQLVIADVYGTVSIIQLRMVDSQLVSHPPYVGENILLVPRE